MLKASAEEPALVIPLQRYVFPSIENARRQHCSNKPFKSNKGGRLYLI